jgi:serine/threonine protein kinase HipA of HipAB toxin-antitoxin module
MKIDFSRSVPKSRMAQVENQLAAKTVELEELKAKMGRMEGSREGIDALLKRVLELEKKLGL